MKLTSESFIDGAAIPAHCAFGIPDATTHVKLSANRNPQLAWSDLPAATQSLVLICHDPDVPSKGDDVNQADRIVPADLPRVDFFHWSLVDLPAHSSPIDEGEFSRAVTPRGKGGPQIARADGTLLRHGLNDYTKWFAGDPDMGGEYYGYDGPCPPWNDAIAHRYVFTLYALDVSRLELRDRFNGGDVREALDGHVLAQASITGRYTLNPSVTP